MLDKQNTSNLSLLMLDLGFKINLVEFKGGYKEKNPFEEGKNYKAQFFNEKGKKDDIILQVKESLWFDIKELNKNH